MYDWDELADRQRSLLAWNFFADLRDKPVTLPTVLR